MIAAESGGSAFSKLLVNMSLATSKGGKELDQFAKVAGVSSSEFAKAFKEDASGALLLFIDGLANAESQGKDAIGMLNDMGITEVRLRDAILRAVGANDIFRESIILGTKAWDENIALTKEAEERYKTLESQLAIAKNRIIDVAIELGGTLAPYLIKVVDKVADLTEMFGKIPKPIQGMIAMVTLGTVALGGILVVIGGLISSVTAISTGMIAFTGILTSLASGATLASGVGTAFGLTGMGTALMALLPLIAPWVAGAAAIIGAGLLIKNKLDQNVIPAFDRFGEGVSDATKKSTTQFLEMNDKVTNALKELEWNSGVLTGNMADVIARNTNAMAKKSSEAFTRQKDESIKILKEQFTETSSLTEEERKRAVELIEDKNKKDQDSIKASKDKINKILAEATKNGGIVTITMQKEIDAETEKLLKKGVEVLSESKADQEAILLRLKENSVEYTVQQSADIAKIANTRKKKVVAEAEEEYEKSLKAVASLREEGSAESNELAKKIMGDATEKRRVSIEEAEATHENIIREAKAQSEEHIEVVDWETGEILNGWQQLGKGIEGAITTTDTWLTENITSLVEKTKSLYNDSHKHTTGTWELTGEDVKRIWGNISRELGLSREQITKNQKLEGERQRNQSNDNMLAMLQDTIKWLGEKHTQLSNWWSRTNQTNSDNNLRERQQSSANMREMYNDTMFWASQKLSGLVGWWNTQREARREQDRINKRESAENWSRIKDDAILKSKQAYEGIAKWWGKVVGVVAIPVNKVIDGANWVLERLGAPKIEPWDVAKYEKGTPTDGHQGGAAMVNDQKGSVYREAVKLPDGREFIPEGRNVIIPNLPIGSHVVPARETKQIYQYAKGTKGVKKVIANAIEGGKNLVSKGKQKAIDVWDFMSKPLDLAKEALSGKDLLGGIKKGFALDTAKGIISKATTQMGKFFKSKFDAMSFEGGGGGSIDFGGLRMTSPFGMRRHPIFGNSRMHSGIDYAGGQGAGHPIKAQMGGIVNQSGWMGGYGNTVKVKLGNLEHMYAHLQKTLVGVGNSITPGQPVGLMGTTGNSTGNHVHYETRRNGKAVNPLEVHGGGGGTRSGSLGNNVERWRGTVIKALGMNGLPVTSNYVNAWLRQIKTESGGNATAVQGKIGDVNNRSGDLAKGLVQVIGATFNRYKFPGHNNRFSGLDSLLAGMNYAKNRYKGRMLDVIGKGRGYSEGTDSSSGGYTSVGEDGEELIIYPDGTIDLTRNGVEVRNLPEGTQVLNNEETQKVKSGANSHKIHAFGKNSSKSNLTNIDLNSDELKMKVLDDIRNNVVEINDKNHILSQIPQSVYVDRVRINDDFRKPENVLKTGDMDDNTNSNKNFSNNGVNINVAELHIREEADIRKLALEINEIQYREHKREQKAGGTR